MTRRYDEDDDRRQRQLVRDAQDQRRDEERVAHHEHRVREQIASEWAHEVTAKARMLSLAMIVLLCAVVGTMGYLVWQNHHLSQQLRVLEASRLSAT